MNGPAVPRLPRNGGRTRGGMIVPKMDLEPDPLEPDWVERRIALLFPEGKAFNDNDLARLLLIRDIDGDPTQIRASNGNRSPGLLRKVLSLFDGHGLKKLGKYDEVFDRIDIEVVQQVGMLMRDLGFSMKLLHPPEGFDGEGLP